MCVCVRVWVGGCDDDDDGFFFTLFNPFCRIVLSEISPTQQILALTHAHILTHSASVCSLKKHVLAHTPHTPAHTNTHTTHTY